MDSLNDTFREIIARHKPEDTDEASRVLPIDWEDYKTRIDFDAPLHDLWDPVYRIYGARPGKPLHGIWVSSRLVCLELHWVEGRKKPCVRLSGDCPLCSSYGWPKWYAYGFAVSPPDSKLWIAEVTKNAAFSCHELVNRQGDLRGKVFSLERCGPQRNAPVKGKIWDKEIKDGLPYDPGLIPHLLRIWQVGPGFDKRQAGEGIPLPDGE